MEVIRNILIVETMRVDKMDTGKAFRIVVCQDRWKEGALERD